VPIDSDRLMAQRMVAMLFKDPTFIRQRMAIPDRAEHAIVALPTDLYWDVVEKARRYPGWVIVFVVYTPPSGTGEARVDIREFLPRQAQPGDIEPDRTMTVAKAFDMLRQAEAAGLDLQALREFAPFTQQRPVLVTA
jgi:hypothetical protein